MRGQVTSDDRLASDSLEQDPGGIRAGHERREGALVWGFRRDRRLEVCLVRPQDGEAISPETIATRVCVWEPSAVCQRSSPVHARTAQPLGVSPPEAVAYLWSEYTALVLQECPWARSRAA